MKKKIGYIDFIIVLFLTIILVKGYNYWNKSEKDVSITLPPSEESMDFSSPVPSADNIQDYEDEDFDSLIEKGLNLLTQRQYEEGGKYFDRALKLTPESAEAWAYKGFALLKQSELQEADICFDKALEINLDMAYALCFKGEVRMVQGNYNEADIYFDKTIEIDPLFVDAWFDKGTVLCHNKDYEGTMKYYNKALEIAPHNPELWYLTGKFLHHHRKKYEEAIKYYDKALELDPQYGEVLVEKIKAFNKLGEHGLEMKNTCLKAIEVSPESTTAWSYLAYSSGKLDCVDEVLELYDEILGVKVNTPELWYEKAGFLSSYKRDY